MLPFQKDRNSYFLFLCSDRAASFVVSTVTTTAVVLTSSVAVLVTFTSPISLPPSSSQKRNGSSVFLPPAFAMVFV